MKGMQQKELLLISLYAILVFEKLIQAHLFQHMNLY
jgi:hypothetical protein